MSTFRWIFNLTLILAGFGLMLLVLDNNGFFDRALNRSEPTRTTDVQAQITQSTRDFDQIVLKSDANGHFWVDAYIDHERITFMVDTGASHVFLTEADAAKIGLDLWDEDFQGTAKTADGIARFAPVLIQEINIDDSIIVKGVPGAVIKGQGNISLLGMSFLNQLSGFEVNGDEMVLKP